MHSRRILFSMIVALVVFGIGRASAQSAAMSAAATAATPVSCSGTSGPLQLKARAVRDTGISPLLVFFDATGTTDTSIGGSDKTFRDVTYTWNFGDTGASGTD